MVEVTAPILVVPISRDYPFRMDVTCWCFPRGELAQLSHWCEGETLPSKGLPLLPYLIKHPAYTLGCQVWDGQLLQRTCNEQFVRNEVEGSRIQSLFAPTLALSFCNQDNHHRLFPLGKVSRTGHWHSNELLSLLQFPVLSLTICVNPAMEIDAVHT